MTDGDHDLPTGWSRRRDATLEGRTVAAFEYRPAPESRFLLTIDPRAEHPGYTLRLSTSTPDATQPEHEYHVSTYDQRANALEDAQALMEELTNRLANGTLSPSDPGIDAVNEAIESATAKSSRSPVSWLRELLG